MPYSVRKVNGKYCVYKKDSGKKVGCTKGTETAKKKYLAALHANADEEEPKKTFKEYFEENYADGKVKGKSRPGRVKKAGASCKGSVTELRRKAKKYGGEKGKMYHWCANMKGGRKKSENEESTSKAPKGKSYDSQNNWKPSDVDAKSDGAGGRYRRTRPNKPGRSRKTHGEEDAEKKISKTRAKCQAKAKRKYDVWPSAYASGYVQKCVNRGGNIK